MRNPIAICLAAVAAAACSSPANNNAAESNGANAAAASTSTPAPVANAAAPMPGAGNEAGNNQPAGPMGTQPNRTANYRASGTEPFWSLDISNGEMTYTTPGGVVGADTPEPRPLRNGFEFRTALLTARFAERPCTEASGQVVPYTVRVTAEGRTANGCGQ